MKLRKTMLVGFVLFLAFSWGALGQVEMNLRVETGYKIGFTSYRPTLKHPESWFRTWPKDFYYLEKLSDRYYEPNIGLAVEGKFWNRHTLQLGCMLGEKASILYIYHIAVPQTGSTYIHQFSSTNNGVANVRFTKVQALYSYNFTRRIGEINGWSYTINPLVGINLLIPTKNHYSGQILHSHTGYSFTTHLSTGVRDTNYVLSTHAVLLNRDRLFTLCGGIDFAVRKNGAERFNVRIYYEQGFRPIQAMSFTFSRENRTYNEFLYTYGSGLHFRLSFPIKISPRREKHKKWQGLYRG